MLDFPGMAPGLNQHSTPPGTSWFQVNAVSVFPGELRARRGFKVVRFDQPPRPLSFTVQSLSGYVMSVASDSIPSSAGVSASSSYVLAVAVMGALPLVQADALSVFVMSCDAHAVCLSWPVEAGVSYVVSGMGSELIGG
jgi:hypothetical protein